MDWIHGWLKFLLFFHKNPERIKDLILTLPDKFQHITTTSHQFKNFLVDKFYGSTGDVLEVGCHIGQTSLILSYLFKNVYAMNCNPPSKDFPQKKTLFMNR